MTLAVGAYVAPTAFSARPQGAVIAAAYADPSPRPAAVIGAIATCGAAPTIPSHASLRQLSTIQTEVQTAISGCAARIEQLNRRQSTLNQEIATGTQRIAIQRQLLAGLARGLYRQPQSILVALTSSHSLGDFFTHVSDIQSASARAQALTAQLAAEQARMAREKASVAASLRQLDKARSALDQASARLQQLKAAVLAAYPSAPETAIFVPSGPAQVIADIEKAFSPLGSYAVNWALRVAKCESGYNPDAVNRWSGTEGLFQFMPSTWRSTPYGHDNVFDPWYNSLGAAWLYQRSGPGQWQCS